MLLVNISLIFTPPNNYILIH